MTIKKFNQRGYTVTELVMVVGLLCMFMVGCAGVYVLAHFLAKLW
jgi:hypothetical protein